MAKISLLGRLFRSAGAAADRLAGNDRVPIVDVSEATTKYALLSDLLLNNRNRIHNGNFLVNQRNVSGTVTLAAGAFGHDRWKAGAAGCTYTFAAAGGIRTITITAGSLVQVIEGVELQTGTHILTWNGTAQGKIGAGSFAASGVTASVTGGVDLAIEFGVGTLSLVQLEPGEIATPFEFRPFQQEIALCQRFFEQGTVLLQSPVAGTVANSCQFAVSKRAIPGVTWGIGSSGSFTTGGIASQGVSVFSVGFNGSATGAGGFAFVNWSASADL